MFDDMLQRSIPYYTEILKRQMQLIEHFYQAETLIYDLGCSNGNLGIKLSRQMGNRPFRMVAVDSSAPMLEAYEKRLCRTSPGHRIELSCQDISRTRIENASVVVLNFTLQFIPPEQRDDLMNRIHQGLIPGGVLLFCEKITHRDAFMAHLQQTFYHEFKRENGYSDLEISQKREALEEVLIPEPLETHIDRLHRCGFQRLDIWQKWFNFAALMAVK